MANKSKIFLDTNVLAYLFDDHAPDKQQRAEQLVLSDEGFVVSTQVMLELYSVLTRKFRPPLTPEQGGQVLEGVSKWEVVDADSELVLQAARTAAKHQISIWDSMVLEAARMAGCSELWTEDLAAGATIRGVTIVNPFETS